jgi:peptidyl-prolyl cis-trans isomerase SurA
MTCFPRFALTLAMNCASMVMLTCALPAHAQTAAVTIYGEAITEDDIEQRAKLNFLSTHKQSARQDVINQLADDSDKIKEAEKSGFDLTNAQVDKAFAEMCSRMRVAPEQLTKSLEGQGIRLDTLKKRIKADMARARLHYYKFQDPPLARYVSGQIAPSDQRMTA